MNYQGIPTNLKSIECALTAIFGCGLLLDEKLQLMLWREREREKPLDFHLERERPPIIP